MAKSHAQRQKEYNQRQMQLDPKGYRAKRTAIESKSRKKRNQNGDAISAIRDISIDVSANAFSAIENVELGRTANNDNGKTGRRR